MDSRSCKKHFHGSISWSLSPLKNRKNLLMSAPHHQTLPNFSQAQAFNFFSKKQISLPSMTQACSQNQNNILIKIVNDITVSSTSAKLLRHQLVTKIRSLFQTL
jgi:hypothetical protein